MSQEEKLVGGVGIVRAGDLEITVTPLSQSEELLLDRRLRAGAQEGQGDYYANCRRLLDSMKDSPTDRLEAVREITRLTALKTPVSGAAFFEYRVSPAGLALELFTRGKKATPGLSLDGLRAVVTEANADDVAGQLFAAIEGGDPKATR